VHKQIFIYQYRLLWLYISTGKLDLKCSELDKEMFSLNLSTVLPLPDHFSYWKREVTVFVYK